MCDSASVPALVTADLDDLVALSKRQDSSGRRPTDTGWVPTWDLAYGAAEGWVRKAGKAASMYDIADAGQSMTRSQLTAHCLSMADRYNKRVAQAARLRYTSRSDPDIVVNL